MKANGLRTAALLGGLSGLLLLIGQMFGGANGLVMGFVLAIGMNFFSYFFSEKMALMMYRAQPVTPAENPHIYSRVYPMVQELCRRMDMPVPTLWVIPEHSPNAFATGRNPSHSSVAFTAGMLELMNDREVEGVLAHELGHIKNRDILTSSIAATIAAAITFAARMAMFMGPRHSDDEDCGSPVGALFMMILAPIAAMLIQMAISRTREFSADAAAAEVHGLSGWPDQRIAEARELVAPDSDGCVACDGAHVHHQAVQRIGVHEVVLDASADRKSASRRFSRVRGRLAAV